MTRSKAVTKTPLSAEGLLALSDRLFTPNLKPPRVIAVPRASSIARSKLSPPWAEIDERPTRRVRRFRLWRDNAPSLRKAVLDPKRRSQLRRYQSYALPPSRTWTFGVRAIPVRLNPKPDPAKPPPNRPLILPRTPYAGNPTIKIPKWDRKARYQRLLQYKWTLNQEHERRFRKGMILIMRDVVRFEYMNYLEEGSFDQTMWDDAEIAPLAEFWTGFFRDIREKSGNIYHHLKLLGIPIFPADRGDEVHKAVKMEDKRAAKRKADKEAKRVAAASDTSAKSLHPPLPMDHRPPPPVDTCSPALIVSNTSAIAASLSAAGDLANTRRPSSASGSTVDRAGELDELDVIRKRLDASKKPRAVPTGRKSTGPAFIFTGERAGELDELDAVRARKKRERRAIRQARRKVRKADENTVGARKTPIAVSTEKEDAGGDKKMRTGSRTGLAVNTSSEGDLESSKQLDTCPSSAASSTTILTPSESAGATPARPRSDQQPTASTTGEPTQVITRMRYAGKVDKRTGVYHPFQNTPKERSFQEEQIRELAKLTAERQSDLNAVDTASPGPASRQRKVFIIRSSNGLDRATLAKLLPQLQAASAEYLSPTDQKGSNNGIREDGDAALMPSDASVSSSASELEGKFSGLDLTRVPSRIMSISPTLSDPITDVEPSPSLAPGPTYTSIPYGDLNMDDDTAAPFASSGPRSAPFRPSLPSTVSCTSESDIDETDGGGERDEHAGLTQVSGVSSDPDTQLTAQTRRLSGRS